MPRATDKRERLVDAAVTLFHHRGYGQTSLSDIAEQSGVPLGNVYYYFKTKADVLYYIVDRVLDDLLDGLSLCVVNFSNVDGSGSVDWTYSVTNPEIDFLCNTDSLELTFTVEIEIPNSDLAIPAGMTSEVILRGEPVLATPVPRSIVTLGNTGELGIRSIDEENKVVFHPIDIVDDSTGALILGGIPEDARIIVSGQNLVTEGQAVEPSELDPETIERLVAEVRDQVEDQ